MPLLASIDGRTTWSKAQEESGNYYTADLASAWSGLFLNEPLARRFRSCSRGRGRGTGSNEMVTFVGAPDYHLSLGDTNAKDQGTNLSADPDLAVLETSTDRSAQAPWDIGADDAQGTTAVKLMSFSAIPGDGVGDAGVADGLGAGQPGLPPAPGPSTEQGP